MRLAFCIDPPYIVQTTKLFVYSNPPAFTIRPPYYCAQTQTIEPLKTSGVCLGIDQEMGFSSCLEKKSMPVRSGDVLLLYSDGITEAMNPSQHLFDQSRL